MQPRFKIVVRDKNGKVVQIHERQGWTSTEQIALTEVLDGYSVTITQVKD